jgi:glutathione S-transferase
MILYSMPSSGNSYKVRLLLALLGRRDVTLRDVEYQTPALAMAKDAGHLPFDRAPVLVLEDGTALPESNAILCYLAEGTDFIPQNPLARAQMLAWMFWEQNQHEGVIAVRAALRCYPHRAAEATPARMDALLERGNQPLQIMEDRLATQNWLLGAEISLADICLFAYTHSAQTRGGYDLARFPAIQDWIARVQARDGFEAL